MVWKKRHACSLSRSAAGSGVWAGLRVPRRDGGGRGREATRRSGAARPGQPVRPPFPPPGPLGRRQPPPWAPGPSGPGETGHGCWDGKGMWSGRESPGPRPDSRAGCLPAHPAGAELCRHCRGQFQPRTEPCPLPGGAAPGTTRGSCWGGNSAAECREPGAAGLCRLPVLISAQIPRGIGRAAPRGPRSLAPRFAPTPRCAADARQRRIRPSAHSRCGVRRGKRPAFPAVPQPESGPEVPSGARGLRGPVAPQDPRSSRGGSAGDQTPLTGQIGVVKQLGGL